MTDFAAPPATVGTLEFRCPNCQKLLRISAAAIGKQAMCPECRTTIVVPNVDGAPTPQSTAPPSTVPGVSQTAAPWQTPPAPPTTLNPMPPTYPSVAPPPQSSSPSP